MKKIKIAILADISLEALCKTPLGRGGQQLSTWLPQLAQALSRETDLEITWIILTKDVKKHRITHLLGQVFYEIPKGSLTLDIITGHFFARRKLQSILDQIKPDIIHVWGSEGSYPSVLKKATVPTIMSMQGILSEYDRIGSFRDNWRMRLLSWYEKMWVPLATLVTSESEWGKEKVRCIAPHADCRIVEYGVNPSFYDLKWDPRASEPCVLYSGGRDWRKGYDILLAALRLPPVPFWKCWIAGGGRTQNDSAMIPENVEVLGNLDWNELQDRMSKAWLLVLPTRGDTSPNAVKEARVVGLPVITTPHGGQAGYIHDGENGFIVDPLTSESLRRAMDTLMSDYSMTRKMGATHHEKDREYFFPERTALAFASIYLELAGSPNSSRES
jgi:glycosyltransferase involved in cell wall biosynthesis